MGIPQPSAVEIYRYVEDWWGDTLDLDLVRKMATSPRRHLRSFVSTWPSDEGFAYRIHSEIPTLGPGELRPAFGNPFTTPQHAVSLGIPLLLYAPSIVVDYDFLFPFRGDNSRPWDRSNAGWASMLWLAAMRALVLDGSVYFANRAGDVVGRSEYFRDLLMAQPRSVWDPHDPFMIPSVREFGARVSATDPDMANMIENVTYACNLAANLGLAEEGLASPVALNADDRKAYSIAASNMRTQDGRLGHLSTLISVQVPSVQLDLSSIVAIRNSSDAFSAWRAALQKALSLVEELPEGEQSLNSARNMLADELSTSLGPVLTEARRSPSLASMVNGWRSFALAGLGAGVPVAAVGEPLLAAVASTAGASMAGVLDEYLRRRGAAREGKAILDVYGWFLEGIGVSPFVRRDT